MKILIELQKNQTLVMIRFGPSSMGHVKEPHVFVGQGIFFYLYLHIIFCLKYVDGPGTNNGVDFMHCGFL
jgi:hypothetical protein